MMVKNSSTADCAISVVICTYNRVECLRDAIQSVCDQEYSSNDFEVLIVDNASTDDTSGMVQEFCEKYPFIHYVMELKVGLSHARNRGWHEARGDYIAYLDDDAKASPKWLQVASQVIRAASPEALGGPYRAFYNTEKPAWFKEEYGSRSLADTPGPLEKRFLSGNNFFVRRDVLERVGGFDASLGMAGDRIAYAEEVQVQRQIREMIPGAVIFYHPDILIYHLVRLDKHTLRWRITSSFASGRDFYMANPEKNKTFPLVLTVKVLLESIGVAFGFLFRNRKQYPFWKNYVYERVHAWFGKVGRAYASWLYLIHPNRS